MKDQERTTSSEPLDSAPDEVLSSDEAGKAAEEAVTETIEKTEAEVPANVSESEDFAEPAQAAEAQPPAPSVQAADASEARTELPAQETPKAAKPKGKLIGLIAAVAALAIAVGVMASSNSGLKKQIIDTDSEKEEIQKKLDDANSKIKDLEGQIKKLEAKVDELENGAAAQLVEIKNAYDAGDWEKVVSLSAELHKKYNGSAEDTEAQQLAADAQAKIDEAAAAKAAEEAKGFETGITYDQLARTPDDYIGSKVKFYGKVVQVIEGDDSVQLRLAVNGDYDNILFLEYDASLVKSRVLEDDMITIYGVSAGTITYKSTMGGNITIPAVLVSKIDQ